MPDYNWDEEKTDGEFIEEDLEDLFDEELEEERRKRSLLLRVIALFTTISFLGLVVLMSFPAFKLPLADLVSQSLQLEKEIDTKRLQRAVVQIDVVAGESFAVKQKSGTGFNIDAGGVIVTNHHVIEDARTLQIRFAGGKIVKADHWSGKPDIDLAVITLRGENLPSVPLEKSGPPSPGDRIKVVGNPLGLNNIVAEGKVKQYLTFKGGPGNVFSIDAPIYPGNSGSPVFNREGKVVGVVFGTWKRKIKGEEITRGLAIPIKEVLKMTENFSLTRD